MILRPFRHLAALVLPLAIAACASDANERQIGTANSPFTAITPTKLVVDGSPGTIALSNIGAITQTLSAFSDASREGRLGDRVQAIRQANLDPSKRVPGLTGLGGILGHAFLDLAEQGLQKDRNFDGGARVIVSLSGQILEYEFDESDGSGLIEAVTYITRSVVTPGLGVPPSRTVAYKYRVEVDPKGFTVVPHSGNRNDPFPGTIGFSPETLHRIESLGFRHKLWAKGTAIRVTDVWLDDTFSWGSAPNFVRLSETDPRYARLYQTDSESCIDMMFVRKPPAMLGGMGPPFYCLGRCGSPLLINTH